MKQSKIYSLSLVVLALTLASCNGSGSSSGTNTTPTPVNPQTNTVSTVFVPSSIQLRTVSSANTLFGDNVVPSSQVSSLKSVQDSGGNSCFTLQSNAGKNFATTMTEWSGVSIAFAVKNTCASPQPINNMPVAISGITMNGSTSLLSGGQIGSSPWLTATPLVFDGSGNLNFSVSTGSTTETWAFIQPGATVNITYNVWPNLAVNSFSVSAVTINGSTPPPPPPPAPGELDVKLDTSKLSSVCTTQSCNVQVNVLSPSGALTQTVSVNPAVNPIYTAKYQNLATGNYQLAVVQSSLPAGTSFQYTPTNAIVSVVSGGVATGSVAFSYSEPAKLGSLSFNLANVSETAFSKITTINGILMDNTTGTTSALPLALGGTYTVNNLPESHSYSVSLPGIADAPSGVVYNKIAVSGLTPGATTTNLAYTKNTSAKYTVTFALATSDGSSVPASQVVNFADNGNYIYTPNNAMTNNATYQFLSTEQVAVTINAPASYSVKYTPTILTGTSTVNVTYTPIVVTNTYDYTPGFQGGAGAVVSIAGGSSLTSVKSATLTTNFAPTVDGSCFSAGWGSNTSVTTQVGSKYVTTVTAQGSKFLNLATTCGLSGGTTVLPGVVYGTVSGVTLDNSTLAMTGSADAKDPGNGKVITGYYAQWSMYGKKYPASQIPFNNINNIVYAFIGFDGATGNIKSLDSWADQNQMPTVSKAMLQYPYMHAYLSFGGWTNAGQMTAPMFDQLTQSQSTINNFAVQAVAAMRAAGYDGIDIDWEWWSNYSVAPSAQQLALYQALRSQLDLAGKQDNKKYYLSIAVSAGVNNIDNSQSATANFWGQVSSVVNYINVMAYDLHGSFDYPGNTYFQAPYGAEALDPYAAKNWNIQAAMNEYEKFSVPSNTLVLGVPLYGRAVTVTTFGATGGLEQAIASATPPYGDYDDASSGPTGIFLYKCIVNTSSCHENGSTISALNFINYLNPLFTTYSSSAQEPWAYGAGPQGNIFLTYDDVHAAVYKTQQVKKNNFGGVMVWELDGDTQDPATSLIANMKAELNK